MKAKILAAITALVIAVGSYFLLGDAATDALKKGLAEYERLAASAEITASDLSGADVAAEPAPAPAQ